MTITHNIIHMHIHNDNYPQVHSNTPTSRHVASLLNTPTSLQPPSIFKHTNIMTISLNMTQIRLHDCMHLWLFKCTYTMTPSQLHKCVYITTLTLKMIVSGIPSLTSWLSPLISTPFLWIATLTVSGNGAWSTITDTRYTMPGLTMRLATTKYVLCDIQIQRLIYLSNTPIDAHI